MLHNWDNLVEFHPVKSQNLVWDRQG
jgi:hypothetical protein